jgi:hypothetical protein
MQAPIVYTRDERVPLSDDDPEMEDGWRCVPVPPDHRDWVIVDSSSDRKTGWMLRVYLIDHAGARPQ